MGVTLKEIAKMAGVSATTVSRVLNGKAPGNMSRETLEKVTRIVELTGYAPNPVASSLRSGSSKVIGIVLPSSTNPYYAQLGSFIENEAYNNEHLIFVCNSNSDVARERRYIEALKNHRVSGILLCSTGLTSQEIQGLREENARCVLLDEEVKDYQGDIVVGDDWSGGRMGAEYLYGLGHREILVILGPEQLSSTKNRLAGFLSFFASIPDAKNTITNGDFTIQSGYVAVSEKLRRAPFTAVFSFNDLMAIGAIHALQTSGARVPADVSVMGYDNIFIDPYVSPGITTVSTPLDELARTAVAAVIHNPSQPAVALGRRTILPRIIERESCGQAARGT